MKENNTCDWLWLFCWWFIMTPKFWNKDLVVVVVCRFGFIELWLPFCFRYWVFDSFGVCMAMQDLDFFFFFFLKGHILERWVFFSITRDFTLVNLVSSICVKLVTLYVFFIDLLIPIRCFFNNESLKWAKN